MRAAGVAWALAMAMASPVWAEAMRLPPPAELTLLPASLAEGDLALSPGMVIDILRADAEHRWHRVGTLRVVILDGDRAGVAVLSGSPDIREGDELIRAGEP